MIKNCSFCGLGKDTDKNEFRFLTTRNRYSARCRLCENTHNRKYKSQNKESISKYQQAYNKSYMPQYSEQNKEKLRVYRKEYRASNKDKIRKYNSKYERDKRASDPFFRLRKDLSRSIRRSLSFIGKSKIKSMVKILPYTMSELKNYLESQFEPWMTWNNQGKYSIETWDDNDSSMWTWQIDHIVPQSSFDFSKEEDIKECWKLSNLRPYSAKLNVIEGDRRI